MNWVEASEAYRNDHLSKPLTDVKRRLNALVAIERTFKREFPELLEDPVVFSNIAQPYMLKLYECMKGSVLSSAERSVINGLYKFSE